MNGYHRRFALLWNGCSERQVRTDGSNGANTSAENRFSQGAGTSPLASEPLMTIACTCCVEVITETGR